MLIYLFSNAVLLLWLDDKINSNFTNIYSVYSIDGYKYKTVILGNSHAEHSLDFLRSKNSEIKVLNLAMAGKPIKYDLFLLNYYKENIDEDALIIFAISFHSLCYAEESYSPIDAIYNTGLPLLGMVRLNRLWDLQSYPRSYTLDSLDFEIETAGIIPCKPSNSELEQALNYIRLINESWSNLILITTPYYFKSLGPNEEFNDFYNVIDGLTSELNITYIDYSRDNRFFNKNLFWDQSHLNSKGNDLFTSIVKEEIIEIDG